MSLCLISFHLCWLVFHLCHAADVIRLFVCHQLIKKEVQSITVRTYILYHTNEVHLTNLTKTSSPSQRSWQSYVCSAGYGKLAGPEKCRRPWWPGYGGRGVTPPEGWCPLSSHSRAQRDSAEAKHSQEEGS